MLLKGYRKEVFRAKCNPSFQAVHCIAHLNEDIGEVIPYLNAELGGQRFTRDPASVTFMVHGKLITVHPHEIAVNALKDEAEADKILEWLKKEINRTWEARAEIVPKYEGMKKPQVLSVLKLLPNTNCGECGLPTCMVFAVRATEGVKGPDDCPAMDKMGRERLNEYLSGFEFQD